MSHRLGDEAALRQHLDEVPVRVLLTVKPRCSRDMMSLSFLVGYLEKREALDAARVGRLGELAPELREPVRS